MFSTNVLKAQSYSFLDGVSGVTFSPTIYPILGSTGSYYQGATTRDKAFDGNLTTYFDSDQANGQWVGLDFGVRKIIRSVYFVGRNDFATRMGGGKCQVSSTPDFSRDVTDLFTIDAGRINGATNGRIFGFAAPNSPATARYARYLSPDAGYGNIAELKFEVEDAPLAQLEVTGNIKTNGLTATNATATNLTATNATATNLTATNLTAQNLTTDNFSIANLSAPITSPYSQAIVPIPQGIPAGTAVTVFQLPASLNSTVLNLSWGTNCYLLRANIQISIDAIANTITPLHFNTEGRGLNTLVTTPTSIATPYMTSVMFNYIPSSRTLTVTPGQGGSCPKNGMSMGMTGSYGPLSQFTVGTTGVGIDNPTPTRLLEIGHDLAADTKVELQVHGGAIFNNDADVNHLTQVTVNTNKRVAGAALTVAGPTYMGSFQNAEASVNAKYLQDYYLFVEQGIASLKFQFARVNSWKDEIFKEGYKLPTLGEVEQFIMENKHLPGVPSESEVKANGYSLGEMDQIFLEKIEHLMLYSIEQNKKLTTQNEKIKKMESQMTEVENLKIELEALKTLIKNK